MRKWIFSSAFLALLSFSSVHAFEAEHVRGYQHVPKKPPVALRNGHPIIHPLLDPINDPLDARLDKFNSILSNLGIPEEPAPDFSSFLSAQNLNEDDLNTRLAYIDPGKNLRRYLNISSDQISLFRDFFSSSLPANLLEFSLAVNTDTAPSDSQVLIAHLNQISAQVKDPKNLTPLTGLSIVLDPGHMGTDFWDTATGKFVQVNGQKVSEGMINLWTVYLVANELEALGATVTLTHAVPGPVTTEDLQTFSTTPYLNQYFYDSLDDWMPKYLGLDANVLQSKPEVQKAFAPAQREEFFIDGADLSARSNLIDQVKPDIVLDVHYDAENRTALQSSVNALEAFVPGGFGATETGSRAVRSYALKQLVDANRWQSSVDLATELVNAMSSSTGVALETNPSYATAIFVKNGVYARNLYITRRNLSSLMVYLECLHYDYTSEFSKLTQTTQTGSYHGTSFSYPARLQSVADGIKTGILNYFSR